MRDRTKQSCNLGGGKNSYINVESVRFKDEQIKITACKVEKDSKKRGKKKLCKIIKCLRLNEA